MRILVCLKSVPRELVRAKVSDAGDRVLVESLGQTINESDEYALEQALALKASSGSEVVVASVGTLTCQDVVYLGLAKGADQGVRIDLDSNDPDSIATVIAQTVTKLECDLVLCGVESSDNLAAQVGTLAAAKLGIPSAYAVVKVEAGDGPQTVKATKEMGGGLQQVLEISLPALLCVQSSSLPLSYAPPAKIIKARRTPLKTISLSDLDVDKEKVLQHSWYKISDVRVPERKGQAQLIEGDAKKVAESILARVADATK